MVSRAFHHASVPAMTPEIMLMAAEGPRLTMPTKISSETPLPTPFSVICSPSHMTKLAPATKVRTLTMPLQRSVRVSTPWVFSMV